MVILTPKKFENPSVSSFYAGKSVFMTGATGFIGKVFIEKLLYTCPDIDKIYLLIREKKGISSNERTQQLLNNPIFERLKEKRPADLDKIVVIGGDISSPDLGISAHDEKILLDKVSVIIHAAATIKFNEPLSVAWKLNVEGTQKMLAFSRRMKHLEVFVHVSTAYSNVNRKVIDEILYPPPANLNEIYQLIKEGMTEEQTKKILNGYPNTYTFSKALAEQLVAENHDFVPTIIVRPSAVTSVKDGPIRGWLDNWNGATGLSILTTRGLNRVVYGDKNNVLDMIPVDYVANLMIIAAARSNKSNEMKVYNCSSSSCNPIALIKVNEFFFKETTKYNLQPRVLPGWCVYTRHKWLVTLLTILFQFIPSYLADMYQRLIGKPLRYMKIYSMVTQTRAAFDFFTSHSWVIKAERVRELFASLSPADQHMFPCDPATINWSDYIRDYHWGIMQLEKKKFK